MTDESCKDCVHRKDDGGCMLKNDPVVCDEYYREETDAKTDKA